MTWTGVFYCPECKETYQIQLEKGMTSVEYVKDHNCEKCNGPLQAELDENRL